MRRRSLFDPDPRVDAAVSDLEACGLVAPLVLGTADERLWVDCELASFAENRLGDATDPRTIDEGRRADWLDRAVVEWPWAPAARDHEHCCWLLDASARAGTIAIGKTALGSFVGVTSLYLFAPHRRRGTARAVLERLRDVLGPAGLGVRLDTSWTWQRAVGFYLRLGMWVRSWKRDLAFQWHADTPPPQIRVRPDRASLSIRPDAAGPDVVLLAATRAGDWLRLHQPRSGRELRWLHFDAMSTFGLALALHGWPLVRSPDTRVRSAGSDLGPPESLARRIEIWEAWDRKHQWLVETPSIPGLEYPTWDELEARWSAAE